MKTPRTTKTTITLALTLALLIIIIPVMAHNGGHQNQSTTDIQIQPETQVISPGETGELHIVITNPDRGIGSYEFNISIQDTEIARITNFTRQRQPQLVDGSYLSSDGSMVRFRDALGPTLYNNSTSDINLATLTIQGESQGTTSIKIDEESIVVEDQIAIFDKTGEPYIRGEIKSGLIAVGDIPLFQVEIDESASTKEVKAGDTATITVNVLNAGNTEGTQSITLTINGEEATTQEVTLGPGESQTIDLEYQTQNNAAPEINASITSDDTQDATTITVNPDDSSALPGFTIVYAMISLVVLSLVVRRSRKK